MNRTAVFIDTYIDRYLAAFDFSQALPTLLGDDAAGLSATNISRLTAVWEQEYQQFSESPFVLQLHVLLENVSLTDLLLGSNPVFRTFHIFQFFLLEENLLED